MDAAEHYRHLLELGKEEFLASSAPAVLVRYRGVTDGPGEGAATMTLDQDNETAEEKLPRGCGLEFPAKHEDEDKALEVYPLTKKPGASFPDRITIGRTANNDIVINESSISRLHAYLRFDGTTWVVADAGSKNGSWIGGTALDPRKERKIPSRAVLRLGDVDVTFLVAADLFAALGGV